MRCTGQPLATCGPSSRGGRGIARRRMLWEHSKGRFDTSDVLDRRTDVHRHAFNDDRGANDLRGAVKYMRHSAFEVDDGGHRSRGGHVLYDL